MSREYALSRVRDAIDKSDGNHLKAQRLLLQWLEKDQSLLVGLVVPHIPAIVSHAISHVMHVGDAPAAGATAVALEVDETQMGEFGEALLSSLKGGRHDGVGFGEAAPRNLGKPAPASQKHIDAINIIAARKNGDKKTD